MTKVTEQHKDKSVTFQFDTPAEFELYMCHRKSKGEGKPVSSIVENAPSWATHYATADGWAPSYVAFHNNMYYCGDPTKEGSLATLRRLEGWNVAPLKDL